MEIYMYCISTGRVPVRLPRGPGFKQEIALVNLVSSSIENMILNRIKRKYYPNFDTYSPSDIMIDLYCMFKRKCKIP
jgi:hypothetical protein